MQDYHEFLAEVLIPEADLQKRIAELGAEINHDYEGKELLLVCITVPHMMDFMSVSSYGVGARRSRGQSRITLDINTDVNNRNVLLVEDIVDSGYTVKAVVELLSARKPKSLKVCALLNKASRREVDVKIDYCGFVIPDKFVFGYGLDADEYYRNLPFIGVMAADKYKPCE